jgi:hypothetical protein
VYLQKLDPGPLHLREPYLASTSTRATKEMQAQQRRFLNVIGLSTKRALHVHKIKPMKDFLNEQRVNKESSKT